METTPEKMVRGALQETEKTKPEPYPNVPLFQFIEHENREWVSTEDPLDPAPGIVTRRTRGVKWFLNGRFHGAWVYRVDDETDFDKLVTALYVARRIRRSKLWAWWYKTFYSIKSFFVHQAVVGNEWPGNLS